MPARKSKTSRKQVLYITLAILAILLGAAGFKIYEDVLAGNVNLEEGEKGYVYVYTGKTYSENIELIGQSGMLNNANAFSRLASLAGYDKLIRPGRYEVEKGTSNLELLRMMVSGRQTPVDVTFKYAQRKEDLVRFFSTKLEADSNELLHLLNDSAFCDSLSLTTENITVLFIPNTYNFYWNTSARQLMQRMIREYRKFWNDERLLKLSGTGLNQQEASVLASIVQKETNRKDEMPVVAGVYLNRLRIGMELRADPTIIYAMNDYTIRRVAGEMMKVESPYNTYIHKGLPPGPICVPSTVAIDAVLNATSHKYLYFCAREDLSGYHAFAVTYNQHMVNARKYHKALDQRSIK